MNDIPVIDFNNFLNGDSQQQQKVSAELLEAIQKYGFVYLKNFGISNDQIENMFNLSKRFFESSIETKLTAKKNHETFCGYSQTEEEKLSNERPGDLKESFMIKQNGTPWPNAEPHLKDFKSTMLEFHESCFKLAHDIIKSLLLGLNVNQSIFDQAFNGECTVLRLLHYPPVLNEIQPNQLRCGEHTDYGSISFLFQDDVGGLEIKTKENKWLAVPAMEDTILVNIGDCIELWTNGFLKATPHRVVNPNRDRQHLSRYSTAFFFDPDLGVGLKSLQEFSGLNYVPKYTSKTYGEHVFNKFNDSYGDFKRKI